MLRSCCSSRRAILNDCNSDFVQTLNLAVVGCIVTSAKARALMLEISGDLRALVIRKFVIRKFVIKKFVIKKLVLKNFCDQGASSRAT
jgi:hypothetical protein